MNPYKVQDKIIAYKKAIRMFESLKDFIKGSINQYNRSFRKNTLDIQETLDIINDYIYRYWKLNGVYCRIIGDYYDGMFKFSISFLSTQNERLFNKELVYENRKYIDFISLIDYVISTLKEIIEKHEYNLKYRNITNEYNPIIYRLKNKLNLLINNKLQLNEIKSWDGVGPFISNTFFQDFNYTSEEDEHYTVFTLKSFKNPLIEEKFNHKFYLTKHPFEVMDVVSIKVELFKLLEHLTKIKYKP